MKIKKFDDENLQAMNDEIEKALHSIAKKYGVAYKAKDADYDDNKFSFPITFYTADGIKNEAAYNKMIAETLGLPVDIIGKEFVFKRERYTVVELKPEKPKYNVWAERISNGSKYGFPAHLVKKYL